MIHPCCPSDEDARRVFMSVLTFINKLKTHGSATRAVFDDDGCPAGDAQYTKEPQEGTSPTSIIWIDEGEPRFAGYDKHRQRVVQGPGRSPSLW